MIIVLLNLTSCTSSTQFVNTNPPIKFPPLPANIENAGKHVYISKHLNNKSEIKTMLTELTSSDRKNARAVNSCKYYYHRLQKIYNQ